MKKKNELTDWEHLLDMNQHIKQALTFAGLTITVFGSTRWLEWGKGVGYFVGFLLIIQMIFQFILGIKEHVQENKNYRTNRIKKK